MPTFDSTYSTGQSVPGGGMTLQEIMDRRRELARTQLGFSQVPTPTIASGIGNMISAFTTGLQQHQAQQQEAQARQAYGQALGSFDPNTGQFKDPNAMATIAMLAPDQAGAIYSNVSQAVQAMARQKQEQEFQMNEPHTPAQWVEYGAQHGKYGDLSIKENRDKYEADRQAAVSTGIKEATATETAGLSAQDFTNNVDAINAEIDKGSMTGVTGKAMSYYAQQGSGGKAYRQIQAGLDALRGQMLQAGKTPAEIADTISRLTPAPLDDEYALHDKVNGIKRELDTYGQGVGNVPKKTTSETSSKTTTAAPKAGDIVDGYRFKGGDPNDQKNWEPAG